LKRLKVEAMPQDEPKMPQRQNRHRTLILLMLICISIPYSNSLGNSWHLDDVANILLNTQLHLTSLSFSNILNTFFAHPDGPGRLYRPVSCLSFALNWFWGKDSTFGYHLINIIIHLLISFFLFKTILLLLNSPRLKEKYSGFELSIAALATIFWAINPLQTQSVTYIVQRMASLAALFNLLGIYFYIHGRNVTEDRKEKKIFYFFLMVVFFFLAIGSKENSVAFPLSVLLVEFIFYKDSKISKTKFFLFIIGSLALGLLSSSLLTEKNILGVLTAGYENRTFSLSQRFLTEFRVVSWYLSLSLIHI
jgi:hypothetical protein